MYLHHPSPAWGDLCRRTESHSGLVQPLADPANPTSMLPRTTDHHKISNVRGYAFFDCGPSRR